MQEGAHMRCDALAAARNLRQADAAVLAVAVVVVVVVAVAVVVVGGGMLYGESTERPGRRAGEERGWDAFRGKRVRVRTGRQVGKKGVKGTWPESELGQVGVPHAEACRMQRRAACRGVPHAEACCMQRRAACRGVPHAEACRMQRRAACRGGLHAEAGRAEWGLGVLRVRATRAPARAQLTAFQGDVGAQKGGGR
eukprot:357078-Chlamydomonas_euryale.AAC.2